MQCPFLCPKLLQTRHLQEESKLRGPQRVCSWKELLGQLRPTWLHQISGEELEASLAAWSELQLWGLNTAAVEVYAALLEALT